MAIAMRMMIFPHHGTENLLTLPHPHATIVTARQIVEIFMEQVMQTTDRPETVVRFTQDAPKSLEEANLESDRVMQEIIEIEYQLEDPTYNADMTDEEFANWKARARFALKMKQQRRSFLKRLITNFCFEHSKHMLHMKRLIKDVVDQIKEKRSISTNTFEELRKIADAV